MAAYTLRAASPADVPALSFLWRDVFGDPLSYTARFYAMLPQTGFALVAERDGRLVGAAHVLCGLELVGKGKKPRRVGYLYAVMVAPAARGLGIGGALTREAAALAERRGVSLFCTLPAEPSLYGWYHRLLGIECVLHRRRYELGCRPLAPVTELNAAEYLRRREALLDGKSHLRPSLATLELQRALGGGLYACGGGLCVAEKDEGVCRVWELLADTPEARVTVAASVGSHLDAYKSVYVLPSREGESYIAALPGSIPADCVWSFSFE